MPGSIAANLHEGFRSEYLAQYVFGSFGTAVSVPSQEDHGLDLYCTLVERKGALAWPKAYFSVQVKSKSDSVSWGFQSGEEVRWLIEYPLPLFLCVVDKKNIRLQVYQTSPRFEVWALPPFPQSLELLPGSGTDGGFTPWQEGSKFSLSAPILDFSIEEMLEEGFHKRIQQVLFAWIGFDQDNLHRIKSGLHSMFRPAQYQTNNPEVTTNGISWLGLGHASDEQLQPALKHLKEHLSWIIPHLERQNDFGGAVRAALLHRHLFNNPSDLPFGIDPFFINRMNARFNSNKYVYDGLDQLNTRLGKVIEELSSGTK